MTAIFTFTFNNLLTHSYIGGHLGYLYHFVDVNSDVYIYFPESLFSVLFGIYLGRELLGHRVTFTFHFYALEKEMANHSSVPAWRIPGMGSHRVGHD